MDWDSTARRESITVDDGAGPRTANLTAAFNQGIWANAPINVPSGGSVTVTINRTAGVNADVSGIFLN